MPDWKQVAPYLFTFLPLLVLNAYNGFRKLYRKQRNYTANQHLRLTLVEQWVRMFLKTHGMEVEPFDKMLSTIKTKTPGLDAEFELPKVVDAEIVNDESLPN